MNIIDILTKGLTQVADKTNDGCSECHLRIGTKDCMIPHTMNCPCAEKFHFAKADQAEAK